MNVGTPVMPRPRASWYAASRTLEYAPAASCCAQSDGVQAGLRRQPAQHLEIADIAAQGEVGAEKRPMELGVLSGLARELGGFHCQP